ncbi:putative mitochondrial reticulon domain protein [Leptomonas pyrrhocoris]|uniref:Reticulon-like protein n=1 Tax=Leptomonas pyrrhocoris TaxID=157538 RepID=A0A0N0VGL1_LEPPY|nr:putative mitochondrial reticulon domain protein [Leptomonas pyrrhocoris]XP_015661764.1 putative mitochondrial reticulon domain protein [Leptomonas pyrrhocoris]KPA83324.1 putative mitochondrial reticulon domain protein [Leptomonas pyrrhocoris]KPA83325.1 putative mitochondrial reticulon domain protein [Leptomonas pyrrhocoris]|eukprot:XP_015661763.1 putative mitochondrial reticulon domain protein [Leptomonas pyrrhocoris]
MNTVTKQFKGVTTKDILAWHRPVASGVVACSIFAFWFVYVYFQYTLTTYAARLATIAFIVGGAAALTKQVSIKSPEEVSARMDRTYESIRPHVTKCVDTAVALITWRDFAASAQFFVATIVLAFVGNWKSDSTLVFVAFLLAFSIPVVYEKKQKEIDGALRQAQAMADKYLSKIKTKAESKKTQVEQQLDEINRKNQ